MIAAHAASYWLVAFGMKEPVLALDDAYDLWSATYPPHAHNPLMRAEQAALSPMLARLTPRRALDVGTGSGRNLAPLSSTGARLVVGLDRSMSMLARHEGTSPRVRADALHLPFVSESFNLLTASLMVGDVPDLASWMNEVTRVLVPGGHLVYSDFHPSWTARRWQRTFRTTSGRTVVLPYYAHSLEEHLAAIEGAGLQIVSAKEPFLLDEDLVDRATRRRFGGVRVALVLHAIRRREPPDSWSARARR
jgi:malonyl-CoA O-methyltransferase